MWSPKETYEVYVGAFSAYTQAADQYQKAIGGVLENADIPLRLIEGRAKQPLSLYTKQKERNYSNPWSDCSDLIGVRLVVPLSRDKERIVEALKEASGISITDVDFKEEHRDPKSLKYGGLHVQVELDGIAAPLGSRMTCEVQVRTIAEHAWAETEHEYVYKGPDGIPNKTRRIFARLLALIELVDDELNRGVEGVAELDSYAKHHLIKFLGKIYSDFAVTASSTSLTVHHVHSLLEAGNYDPATLESLVTNFTVANEGLIRQFILEHGPKSPQFDVDEHVLVAQPELLLILALLDDNPFQLANAVHDTDLFHMIKPIALWHDIPEFVV